MKKYIALLRGINISGRNKVSMEILKKVFEKQGFLDVKTYINSGNIIFSTNIQDIKELTRKCKTMIADEFHLDIPVVVISIDELEDTINHAPTWWNVEKDALNYMIFVISPVTVEEVYEAVGEPKSEYEKVGHYGNVIFWTAPLKTYPKAKWYKIASSAVNDNVTIRNATTIKKVIALAK